MAFAYFAFAQFICSVREKDVLIAVSQQPRENGGERDAGGEIGMSD